MTAFFHWLHRHRDIGVLVLRLFIGFRLIYGVLDNVLNWQKMLAFRDFLAQFYFPLPLVCAVLSVYGQLLAAGMVMLGWKIRFGAIILIINFGIAWIMVDRHGTVESMTPALAMLFCAVLFLFQGGGKFGFDKAA